ncbi:DNA polymerase III subunit gamma/tau [Halanaerobium congolense]|uniref:DNA-directed DNA polymerase n=1 Tax=Halanaerobium congolense TaxID=54121 RepID=A0A1G8KPX2_9FIRM|nr:DNA polymerase III subunit gamma/tau [Halanaerobium congolense]KXS47816.1 MAG: DNA polymerase III subunit gamma/tau [Halanaerobium sp. T82-1]OEG62707.1 MAG: DNA polymerase III subunit gamma/tau [Halanaerobium sp. MDAL1]PUU89252.1 MAG: DNA polymerase III subunit gamma/tau [Halanaerobium sp.]TDS33915.1 DNA polymerase-3 subunit gamma/tau [Halanaerobium congolense]SDI45521.1 DNA polymerase-3 subunit gamma/tau [Halanaerobium congolense]
MSFLSLYRKYRPENFNDLIGQDQVKQTLKNALKNDRVAHAYLFAGPRGTGKTSTAKVFAKSLNCANPSPNFEPCGECNSCQRIEKGNSLDVIEIDAASNRGIDEIRELREKVKFYPGEGKYKVYIIDEVHMLTKGAFNALLKTLEEPPESVVFILATTEPHEVITTIMSRCQRFDFTLLTLNNLKQRLEYIAASEGYEIEKEALDILARSARGGMRDAISLLDQAISFSDGQLSAEKITRMLGRINKTDLKQFLVHLSKKQSQQALELLNKQLESGLGIERFSDELIEYCRELLLIKECGIDSGILEYSRSYLEEIASAAANLSTKEITQIIDEFASLKEKLRSSARPRLQLEISVIKLSSRESSGSGLEARLSEIEFKLNNLLTNKDNSNFKKELTAKKSELGSAAVDDNIQKNKEESTNDSSDQQKAQIEEDSQSKKEIEPKTPAVKENAKSDSSAGTGNLSLEQVKDNWGRVLNEIRQLDVSVQALLREGEPLAVDKKTVTVAFPETKKFHYKGAVSNKALISRVLRNVLNEAVELELQLGAKKKELNEARTNQAKKNDADIVEDSSNSQNNKKTKTPASKSKENDNFAGDLDIENLARIFSGEIIEVDQSILENRGGK